MSQNLFFEIQQVKVRETRNYNPVPRKIIDVRMFKGQELQYSSIATRYIQQSQNNQLISEQKQLRLDIQQAVRLPHQFPYPRRVEYNGPDNELHAFNQALQNGFPPALDVQEYVDEQFVASYVALAQHLTPEVYMSREQKQNRQLTSEELAFYAISAYLPPVNQVGEAFRQFTKACGCTEKVAQFYAGAQIKMLMAAGTRKWEGEPRSQTLHRLFSIAKLLWHTQAFSKPQLSYVVCCCCGNNSLSFAEAKEVLFEKNGIFEWVLAMKEVLGDLVKAGFVRKVTEGITYFLSDEATITEAEAGLFADVMRATLNCHALSQKWIMLNYMSRISNRAEQLAEEGKQQEAVFIGKLASALQRK